jgi:hypothetical protein
MPRYYPCLTWTDTADPATPMAVYEIDFVDGADFTEWNLSGTYHGVTLAPLSAVIDNTPNAASAIVWNGPRVLEIPGFQRVPVSISRGSSAFRLVATAVASFTVEFWPDAQTQQQIISKTIP